MLQLYRNIKSRRIELGMTQTELAHKTGYADKSAIAKIERGLVDIPQSKIMLFADALDIPASDLMGDDGVELSSIERDLLTNFRALDRANQEAVMQIVAQMALTQKNSAIPDLETAR